MTHPTGGVRSIDLEALRGRLIVSCQAYPGEPMRDPRTMAQVAAAVVEGGAAAVRTQGVDDIRAVRDTVDVPVIGIWKDGDKGVFITPTLRHARAVIEAGADIVGIDGTLRPRPDGIDLTTTIRTVRETWGTPVMADCDSLAAALVAADAGAEIIGTTLAGYTGVRERTTGPDLDLLEEIVQRLPHTRVVAEGRFRTPSDVQDAFDAGAFAVAVGTAITHPTSITREFVQAVPAGA